MPSPKLKGVYALTNTITGNSYVGRARDLANRKSSHLSKLRTRTHKNWRLQGEADQHGLESFEFSVIQYAPLCEHRTIEDQYLKSNKFSYNISKTSAGGPPVTKQTRERMSAAHKDKTHSPETIAKLKARPAETNGGFIGYYTTPAGIFPSAYQAEAGMGGVLNFTTIKRWCRNPNKPFKMQSYRKSAYLQSFGLDVIGKTPAELGFGFEPAKRHH